MKTINKTPDISFDHDLSHLGINNSILDYSVLNQKKNIGGIDEEES